MNPFFHEPFGEKCSSGLIRTQREAGEARTGLLRVRLQESSSTRMVRRYTCKERRRADGATAITFPNASLMAQPETAERGGVSQLPELERAVAIAARRILSDRAGMLEALEKSGIESPDVRATLESVSNLSRWQDESNAIASLVEIVNRVELRGDGISVTLRIEVPCSHAGVRASSALDLARFVPLRMKQRGVETRIVMAAGDDLPRNLDPPLLKAVARSRAWFEELASGDARSLAEIARRQKMTRRYVERLSRLAFVAPRIAEAICQGRQPAELSPETLLKRIDLPLEWPVPLKAIIGVAR
jgi:site-specific DNA recombinase